MSEKKPFVLRIDPEKLKALEKWAADEFRSTNGQIEYILDQALKKAGRLKNKSENTKVEEDDKTS
ncbi:MAG: Arc family DNA-binding protein [Bacteroidales bacterium]|nr:Arc family DNA-binding protein [Bacteroidales bacterium]